MVGCVLWFPCTLSRGEKTASVVHRWALCESWSVSWYETLQLSCSVSWVTAAVCFSWRCPNGGFLRTVLYFFWSSVLCIFSKFLFLLFPLFLPLLPVLPLFSSIHTTCVYTCVCVIRDMHAEIISSIKNLQLDGEDPRKLLQSWGRLRFPRHVLQWVCRQSWRRLFSRSVRCHQLRQNMLLQPLWWTKKAIK